MDTNLDGRYRAILFDVGWTLVYSHPARDAVIQNSLRIWGCAPSPVQWDQAFHAAEAFHAARRWEGETSRNLEAFWYDYYSVLLANVLPGNDVGRLAASLAEEVEQAIRWHPYPDVREGLAELRKRGFALGAVSNWNPGLPGLMEEWGLVSYLDALVVSDIVGCHKPDRHIFELVLTALQVPADRALHVGDDVLADVEGARAAGITPVLMDRDRRCHGISCLRVCTLAELLSLVGRPCLSC